MGAIEVPIVVVLGMHRGGTSALTRGVQALGVRLGDRLMPALPDNNETGFGEDLDIYDFNERLLEALGARWDGLGEMSPQDLSEGQREALVLEAAVLLWAKTRAPGPFGFKDPRTARLLSFWQPVFARVCLKARYLIALRNPLSVARSLARRDNLAPERAHLLWLRHMVPAVQRTMGAPRLVVDYDRLLADPRRELGRIAAGLGLPLSNLDSDEVRAYCEVFLRADLRHAEFPREALEAATDIIPLVREAHGWLDRLARDDLQPDDDTLARAWSDIDARLGGLAPLLAHVEATSPAAPVWSARPPLQADRGIALLHGAAATYDQAIADLTARAEDLARALSAMDGTLAQRDRTLLAQQEALEAVRSRLAIIEGSTSWRLMAPFREAAHLIRRLIRR